MARETITRCSICKKRSCDGKEYIVPAHFSLYSSPNNPILIKEKIVCSSMIEDGYYTEVEGHGVIGYIKVIKRK